MVAVPPPRVFTIPAGLPFADALAEGLLARHGGDPLAFADMLVLLPTRRAARSLREAFLRRTGGRPLLLPRLRPLGDVEEDELAFVPAAGLGGEAAAAMAIPPAIDPLERELLLTRLVLRWLQARDRAGRADGGPDEAAATPAQAAALARELARLLDQMQTEGVPLDRLETLVAAEHAEHWQLTLDFLDILRRHWPAILAERDALDPAEHRNRLLAHLAAAWQAAPPPHPVIAAGSTGSIPATRALLKTIAGLPQGAVVLPGLDTALDEAGWQALDQTHPQFGLRELLAEIGIARDAVAAWEVPGLPAPPPARLHLLSEAMRPAASTDSWQGLPAIDPAALDGVARLDAATPQLEALAIALAMRAALETQERTAALVTADRGLARRVATELTRWGIAIDDSAGHSLAETPPGAFLRLIAAMAEERFAPVPLLAALKHPFAALGLAPARCRALVRQLEIAILRGPRPAPGIAGLRAALAAAGGAREENGAGEEDGPATLLDRLEPAMAELEAALAAPAIGLDTLVAAHVAAAEALAATDTLPGGAVLWRQDAGEAAAALLQALADGAAALGPLEGRAWPALLDGFLAGRAVRPRHGRHPRLSIWGPLEARLQRADLLILGGLNEGSWPPEVDTGPWLNRPMREQLGLPLPERRIGLAAHDFAQAMAAPEVLLTRAERVEGAPTVKARWLARLDALLGYDPARWSTTPPYVARGQRWLRWAEALDEPAAVQIGTAPAPRPPLAARPRELSVSRVETWRRDPYALYAEKILRLRALDPIDMAPGAAERGTEVHGLLDAFLRETGEVLPPDAEDRLLAFAERRFAALLQRPGERAFWWPRFRRAAAWFVARERARRAAGARTLATETSGRTRLEGPAGPFVLTAKADRIDLLADGGWEIIDYKTGRPPSEKAIVAGYAPQLPLEAVIALDGGFDLGAAVPSAIELSYWQLGGGEEGGSEQRLREAGERIAQARAGLAAMIRAFDEESMPYRPRPRPDFAGHGDYDHLARVKEWSSGSGEET